MNNRGGEAARTIKLKVKPISRVRAAQSNQSEGQSDTKEGQHFGAPGAPTREVGLIKLHI
jgi:hypothetical protein